MVKPQDVIELALKRVTPILDAAEAALAPHNFEAYRRIVLREFGDRGLTADLKELFRNAARNGTEWNGPE